MTNHTTATVSHDTTWLSTVATHFGRHLRAARRDSAVITNTVAGPVLMFLVMRWLFGDSWRLLARLCHARRVTAYHRAHPFQRTDEWHLRRRADN